MKQLILMRHAQAESDFNTPDEKRALSEKGQITQKAVVTHLKEKGFNVDLILCSPFLRTEQSAAIAQKVYPHAHKESESALADPFDLSHITSVLRGFNSKCALCIGHAPTLETWGVELTNQQLISLAPSSCLILECDEAYTEGKARLIEHLQAS